MKAFRLKFTLFMLAILIALGIYGRAHVGDVDVRHQVGFSTKLLLEGQLHRVVASLMFTAGGSRFYASLLMFAGAVGWVEWMYGTRRAMLVFFGVHILTLLMLSLAIALPLAWLETYRGELLFSVRDVGPSAGYYGCLGFAIGNVNKRCARLLMLAFGVLLATRLGWSAFHLPEQGRVLSADLAHAIAFPLGWLVGRRNAFVAQEPTKRKDNASNVI